MAAPFDKTFLFFPINGDIRRLEHFHRHLMCQTIMWSWNTVGAQVDYWNAACLKKKKFIPLLFMDKYNFIWQKIVLF
jgi:hypothetical protein